VQKWLVPWLVQKVEWVNRLVQKVEWVNRLVQKVEWVNRSEEERVLALGLLVLE